MEIQADNIGNKFGNKGQRIIMTIKICENCKKGELEINETRDGYVIKRGFTGKKGPQFYAGTTHFITLDCPICGAHHGERIPDRARAILRMQSMGLPMIIRSG
jgi:hypothetical protein